jgi:hypothetical protein
MHARNAWTGGRCARRSDDPDASTGSPLARLRLDRSSAAPCNLLIQVPPWARGSVRIWTFASTSDSTTAPRHGVPHASVSANGWKPVPCGDPCARSARPRCGEALGRRPRPDDPRRQTARISRFPPGPQQTATSGVRATAAPGCLDRVAGPFDRLLPARGSIPRVDRPRNLDTIGSNSTPARSTSARRRDGSGKLGAEETLPVGSWRGPEMPASCRRTDARCYSDIPCES